MGLLIRVEQGDISTFHGDGVVCAANNHLRMGAGVAGALSRRGGPQIQYECDDYVRRHGPLEVGEAAVTGGGDLPCRWVIHAAAMGDVPPSAESVRSATRNALNLAAEHRMSTVAFPVLGSGIGGYPFEQAATIMLDELHAHAAELPEVAVLFGYSESDAATLRRLSERG